MPILDRFLVSGIMVLALSGPLQAETLYGQPPFTETELNELVAALPRFRAWVSANGEAPHPALNADGEPDFLYSPKAAAYLQSMGWKPERFFCVMGRAAAAVAIIQQGNAITTRPPADMPNVSPAELEAVRKHLPAILQVTR